VLKFHLYNKQTKLYEKKKSCQGYYGLFILHLTPLNAENGRKIIEGMKIRLRAIEGSSKKKRSYEEEAFF